MNDHGVFLNGYDVVSYFTANEATQGSSQHSLIHDGVTYYFSSNANKEAFAANPSKYTPKYGGFCAFAVANDKGGVKAVAAGPNMLDFSRFENAYPFQKKWIANGRQPSMSRRPPRGYAKVQALHADNKTAD